MKVLKQNKDKIVVEFDLLDFHSLQEFFEEQKQAVEDTGKFEYEAVQKFKALKLENSTFVNDMRLKRINQIFEKNQKLLDEN